MKMLVEKVRTKTLPLINVRFQIGSNAVYVELCRLMDYAYEKC